MFKFAIATILLVLLFASTLDAHGHEGGYHCGHETEMAKHHSDKESFKKKFVDLAKAKVMKKRVKQTFMNQQGVQISRELASTRTPIRVSFHTDYLLNDYESRTCYSVGQVCLLFFQCVATFVYHFVQGGSYW